MTVKPRKEYTPDIDLILNSDGQEDLFLQLKQVIKWESTPKSPQGTKTLIFKGGLFEETIKKAESCYYKRGNDISHLILILHSGRNDYFIPSDTSLVDAAKFKESGFKGIYIVSPKYTLYGHKGKSSQEEFVFEIKAAF
ncbi:MAG: hypothetical protein COS49_00215 [Candidatus Portnoybacteria bacterium CG03_land_8_20_14_0_80_41_10]|uniref:Uncharacterized protein n=1 Tax=Candidatus Portnoybacteria bacterium CG03_land_8_20_14_0_80_41_10 TaxID=1974808 RepID=A0A2M7BV98_9BACT|nr:MAG: hypothetical protein COS49_00215 [Candidatus Portnoybacteria bacterium CG03_land_8_20_14_0_80_41_10]